MAQTRLYLISPPALADIPVFAEELKAALDAGKGAVGAFQLRLKQAVKAPKPGKLTLPSADADDVLRAAEVLLPVCHAYEIPFILNDDPQLAKRCGADGVHLGQEDMPLKAARAILGEAAVIGVSCHDSTHLAMEAGEAGADYVAFGAFYPTTSKTEAAKKAWGVPTPGIIKNWVETTTVPCVAIGGIASSNCAPLIQAGADFIAVITAVWEYPNGVVAGVKAFSL